MLLLGTQKTHPCGLASEMSDQAIHGLRRPCKSINSPDCAYQICFRNSRALLRTFDHLQRMRHRLLGDFLAAQHPRNFLHFVLIVQQCHGCIR